MSSLVFKTGEMRTAPAFPFPTFGGPMKEFPDSIRPGVISWGLPFDQLVLSHVKRLGCSRVFAIASGSLARNTDSLARLKNTLGELLVAERIGVKSHSPWDEILEIAQAFKAANADILVTLGGGSVTDSAEAALLAVAHDAQTLDDLGALLCETKLDAQTHGPVFYPPPQLRTITTPLILVPTTLSAGEYTPAAGAVDPRNGVKYQFGIPMDPAPVIVLDPEYTLSTPEWVWLSTGVRAIDHAVETLSSPYFDDSCRNVAVDALMAIIKGLIQLKKVDWNDLQARFEAQVGAKNALGANCQLLTLGASHGIGHMLGPLGHIGHGQTSCILLPAVSRYNYSVNASQQEHAKASIWNCSAVVSQVLRERGLEESKCDLADTLDALFRELGMPRSMQEAGIDPTEAFLDKLAENSLKDFFIRTNPKPLPGKPEIMEILKICARPPWTRKTGETIE